MKPIASDIQATPSAGRPSLPGVLLRFEGLAVLVSALVLYADQGWSWVAFVLLVLISRSLRIWLSGQQARRRSGL